MDLRSQLQALENRLDQMDPSDPGFAELNDECNTIADEMEQAAKVAEVRRQKRIDAERLAATKDRIAAKIEANGSFRSYDDWYKWAMSLYRIDDNFTVHSKARNWNEEDPMYWTCCSEAEALEKIEQLINYKIYDRNRGSGDMTKDLSI